MLSSFHSPLRNERLRRKKFCRSDRITTSFILLQHRSVSSDVQAAPSISLFPLCLSLSPSACVYVCVTLALCPALSASTPPSKSTRRGSLAAAWMKALSHPSIHPPLHFTLEPVTQIHSQREKQNHDGVESTPPTPPLHVHTGPALCALGLFLHSIVCFVCCSSLACYYRQ